MNKNCDKLYLPNLTHFQTFYYLVKTLNKLS